MTDILGPANAANAVTTRITEARVFPTTDTWFKPCSTPAAQDGTQIQSLFLNGLLAQLRAAIRGNGLKNDGVTAIIAENNANDAMLLGAVQQLIQRGQCNFVPDTGTADAMVVAPAPALAEYEAGLRLLVLKNPLVAANATTTPTINAGLGAVTIVKNDGSALGIGDLKKGGLFEIELNGANPARLVSLLTLSDVLALIPPAVQAVTRVNLPGNLTVYVRPDGSDAGNGSTNTSSAAGGANCAFATIQGAIAAVFGKYNLAGYSLKIQLALSTGQTAASFAGVVIPAVGVLGNVLIQGDDANQGNYVVTPVPRGDGSSVCVSSDISTVTVSGVTTDQSTITSGSSFLATLPGAQIVVGNLTVKATANTPLASIFATYPGGSIARSGNVTINGTGGTVASVFQILEGYDGGVPGGSAKTLSINGLTYTQFYNVDQGRASLLNTTFVANGVTGSKYNVTEGGVLALANGSLAAIPGTGGSAVGGFVAGDPGALWNTFSPGVSTSSGAISSASGGMRWQRVGRTVVLEGVLGISNNGSGAGYITLSLPIAANATTTGSGSVTGNSKALTVIASAGAASMTLTLYDGTYPGATGATLAFQITYEAAA